jgi:hypothetical protein
LPPSSSSSSTTFSDKQAINAVPRKATEDDYSSFCELQPAPLFGKLEDVPPLRDFEIPSLGQTDFGRQSQGFQSAPLPADDQECPTFSTI